jgi:hypothetical protein
MDTLIPKAEFALRRVTNRLGITRTDAVNRAIQLYDLIEDERANGGSIYVKHGDEFRELTWDNP